MNKFYVPNELWVWQIPGRYHKNTPVESYCILLPYFMLQLLVVSLVPCVQVGISDVILEQLQSYYAVTITICLSAPRSKNQQAKLAIHLDKCEQSQNVRRTEFAFVSDIKTSQKSRELPCCPRKTEGAGIIGDVSVLLMKQIQIYGLNLIGLLGGSSERYH